MNTGDHAHVWASRLERLPVPQLARTRARLVKARQRPDLLDANSLAEIILRDPLMTLNVLAHASASRSARVVTAPETVRAAIMLIGLDAFDALVDRTPVLETDISPGHEAMSRIRVLLRRARRAGRIALTLAAERQDPDAALIYEAALFHDVTEMLLWLAAPDKAREVVNAMKQRDVDACDAQARILGCTLNEIALRLLQAWQLSSALIALMNAADEHQRSARVTSLAVRFAAHAEVGWSHPHVLADLHELSGLMGLSLPAVRNLLGRVGGT